MKDGMGMLVQGLSGGFQVPADAKAAERLDRVEKTQLEIKEAQRVTEKAQKVAEEVAEARHQELLILLARPDTSK
jgi:hypothetical protein